MAAMVPYGNQAQFQIMWRGVVQLCLRTNQYSDIQCTEIYRDELKSHNPITGKVEFHRPEQYKLRYSDTKSLADVVGYYAQFTLTSGFVKSDFMTHAEAMAHAKKYSKAYQYDLAKGKKSSQWSIDPIPMGRKSILLRLLGRWGIKSVQLEKVMVGDQEDFATAQASAEARIACESGTEPIDTQFEPNGNQEADGETEPEATFLGDDAEKDPDTKAKAEAQKEKLDKAAAKDAGKGGKAQWRCKNHSCDTDEITPEVLAKHKLTEPKTVGKAKKLQCPECLRTQVEAA
jgi:recombination protein RecT